MFKKQIQQRESVTDASSSSNVHEFSVLPGQTKKHIATNTLYTHTDVHTRTYTHRDEVFSGSERCNQNHKQ